MLFLFLLTEQVKDFLDGEVAVLSFVQATLGQTGEGTLGIGVNDPAIDDVIAGVVRSLAIELEQGPIHRHMPQHHMPVLMKDSPVHLLF